jgi:hypothetical protein
MLLKYLSAYSRAMTIILSAHPNLPITCERYSVKLTFGGVTMSKGVGDTNKLERSE